MPDTPSMQETIRRLHEYWAAHGCQIWQPHSEKLGAGTMNPATVLRVLGPEPWNVAYVEPSFRADDGRYAENPNRMQMHTQYQVILKPDPGNPQELYLSSLEAIGLQRDRHDIRFVEDNWESPALGAWGLGWEVWLDGQEITQFTYFQQAGGVSLDPVSVEITYGLERIVMYLQQRTEVWSIDFDGVHTYGEIYRQQEIEHCIYNFELADVGRQRTLCDLYHAEADACIERGLVAPAHDYVLRQSQAFNILDTRGAIGVTERAKFFAAMRSQARRISELYVEQRQREEYPWLENGGGSNEGDGTVSEKAEASPAQVDGPRSLLIELGSEELPAGDVPVGIHQLELRLRELLEQARLTYKDLTVSGTARRLVAHIRGLSPRQQDETLERRGPPADRAFDADGQPTRAAAGFARGQGVEPSELVVRDNYVYAVTQLKGEPAAAVLPQLIEDLLDGMQWGRTMRWNRSNKSYPRPLRWIVALHGSEVIPMSWANVSSGRESRGPRFRDAQARLPAGEFTTFTIADADTYFAAAADQGIQLDRQDRRRLIAAAVQKAAARARDLETPEASTLPPGVYDWEADEELLDEVSDLVEAPQAVLGSFETRYLDLPPPILTAVMKKHQRYFPVLAKANDPDCAPSLAPRFVTIANADALEHPDVVRQGNEGVIRARYADAEFFYNQDTAKPLDTYTRRLETLTFHAKLGSMLEKAGRLQSLAPLIAHLLGAGNEDVETSRLAAALCKTDLVTSMVVEMTSLQGIMGEIYALESGERPAVAQAIREHYLPRYDGDSIPMSKAGLALSLADKLDSLVGLFGVGVTPSGSADPFGLRRAALGIVNALTVGKHSFDLTAALGEAASQYGDLLSDDAVGNARDFVIRRLERKLRDSGHPPDVVDAVLAARGDDPFAAVGAVHHLAAAAASPDWEETLTAYARCARIVRGLDRKLPLQPAAYQEQVEHELHSACDSAAAQLNGAADIAASLGRVLAELAAPINSYFDAVLVNAEEEEVRQARQALIQRIARLPAPVADLSRLQGF
ncbi:MAG: glycine--tRNA ligase subunit beta [Caldilineaceae bacterium SB0664_bin_27]|uniref:Multifunctional fusion protein n=1 Tax=Caldilineaceae bacterium SB0664_bin_27 TaxID=2605260 RepID=A0A6B0YPW1_9CHLR|nr:glycine--tRNA ligase subunit beta [Caldilineaceae bacterium SB0664_bin_27]